MKTKSSESLDTRNHILETADTIMRVKGFSAVGLSEILHAASVPKGSFYHYFSSKEHFGEALLQRYFENYLADIDALLARLDLTGSAMLQQYFASWGPGQLGYDASRYCLIVKLAAEVSDLSEPMRITLLKGTNDVVARLATMVERGITDGSIHCKDSPVAIAEQLYQLWLGAALLGKITRDVAPFQVAMQFMQQQLQ